jgi:transcriptional regulator with XRE-family HTH domain
MMNMQRIGRKICDLRKQMDMTQVELADKLNVSYQAVSSWERGLTMPDIAKLPEISQVLQVSVDELLDSKGQADLIQNILNSPDAAMDGREVYVDEIEEIAPILKPKQVDNLAKISKVSSIAELSEIAPFVSRGVLDELVKNAAKGGSIAELSEIAPFVSKEVLDELARNAALGGNIKELAEIAPFVSKEVLNELARNAALGGNIKELTEIAPFVSREVLDELVRKMAAEK